MTGDERLARAHLSRVVEPGDPELQRHLQVHGSRGLLAMVERGEAPERWVRRHRDLSAPTESFLAQAERAGVSIVVPGDPQWPAGLDDLPKASLAPVLCLWVRGRVRPAATDGAGGSLAGGAVAVVGARARTRYGEQIAGDLADGLARAGVTVVSGGALGVDGDAHRAAAAAATQGESGDVPTVAVLGCGVDRAYPQAHAELFRRILDVGGGLVAELPPGASPFPWRFPLRNRVIAAMTRATVVVEAGRHSGAATTAAMASALCRVVGAVPGPVHSHASTGCHRLIREHVAELVTGLQDVLELCGGAPVDDLLSADWMPESVTRVHRCLSATRVTDPDAIVVRSGLDARTVRAGLLDLELRGLATRRPHGWLRVPVQRGG
jgi:DNA processing protein